jgi:hypothetical protein
MVTRHEGGCACGAVRYEVRGDPEICQVCHCRFCQRRTGSAFGTVAYFDERNVSIMRGELNECEHRSDETGRWLRMQFCPQCGTTVAHTVQIRPGLRAVAVGTLDDPDWPRIQRHIWVQSKRSWVSIPAGMVVFSQGAPGSPDLQAGELS